MSKYDVNVTLYFVGPSTRQASRYDYDQDDYEPDYTDWEEEVYEDDYDEDEECDDEGLYGYYYDPFPEYDHYPYGCYDAPAFTKPLSHHEGA